MIPSSPLVRNDTTETLATPNQKDLRHKRQTIGIKKVSQTFGAGGRRSARPPGCLPSAALWPASSQNLSSWPTPGHDSESGKTKKNGANYYTCILIIIIIKLLHILQIITQIITHPWQSSPFAFSCLTVLQNLTIIRYLILYLRFFTISNIQT